MDSYLENKNTYYIAFLIFHLFMNVCAQDILGHSHLAYESYAAGPIRNSGSDRFEQVEQQRQNNITSQDRLFVPFIEIMSLKPTYLGTPPSLLNCTLKYK